MVRENEVEDMELGLYWELVYWGEDVYVIREMVEGYWENMNDVNIINFWFKKGILGKCIKMVEVVLNRKVR